MFKSLKKFIQKSLFKSNKSKSNCQFLPENTNKTTSKIKVKIIRENDCPYDYCFECIKRLDQYGEAIFDVSNEEYEFDQREIYICCISHDSTCYYELSTKYMEKFTLINGTDTQMINYYLVKSIQTGRIGYVPKYCLSPAFQFYSDLHELKKNVYL